MCLFIKQTMLIYTNHSYYFNKIIVIYGGVMIPKIIHYVWVGEKEKPELTLKCIESWKRYCSDYQIIEWNNESLKEIDNLYVKQAFEAKKWAFVSDYLRLYALKNYGGIYVDSDLEITNNLDEFLDNNFVSGYENYYNYYSPITALMGAQKNDKIIGELLAQYDNLNFIKEDGSLDLTTNTKRITYYFEEKYGLKPPYYGQELTQLEENVIIYPSYYFCVPEENKPNYSIHHFSGSWLEKPVLKYSFLQKIFSIKNSVDGKHKIFCILGLKVSKKRKK